MCGFSLDVRFFWLPWAQQEVWLLSHSGKTLLNSAWNCLPKVPTVLQPTTYESDFQLLHCISSVCSCQCSEPEPFYQAWGGISFNIPFPRDIDGQPLTICWSPLVKYPFGSSEYILSCLPVTVVFSECMVYCSYSFTRYAFCSYVSPSLDCLAPAFPVPIIS